MITCPVRPCGDDSDDHRRHLARRVEDDERRRPTLSAVGTVTDVVLKPPEPAKTMPCEEPKEPSKQRSGALPPAPQVVRARRR
jgi:hypothetical protein